MLSKEEIQVKMADLLKEMRLKRNLSKTKMASLLYLDDKTYARYENGTTAPTGPEFIWICNQIGESVLQQMLPIIYPNVYEGLVPGSNINDLRKAAAHYCMNVASDKMIREWDYIMFGDHGSNIEPQINMFTMLDHLPLCYRVAVANMIVSLYKIAEANGDLVGTSHVMPDTQCVIDALSKAQRAAEKNRMGYTTAQI